jgi:hypothetical protein
MRIRRNRLAAGSTLGAVALLLVAVIGAAQAAPQTKKFSATVHVADNEVTSSSATLTLIVTNKTRSQTLGSAEFKPPTGVVLESIEAVPTRPGWGSPSLDTANNTFRLLSTSNALGFNQSVSADVSVSIDQSACNHATSNWTPRAKQSNDFSGNPGNDIQFDPQGSDLIALGRFDIATIETVTSDDQHVPAILTNVAENFVPHESTTTAYDICGEVKTTYSGADRTATLLTDAEYDPNSGLDWDDGVGTVDITPVVTETDNRLHVSDETSGVTADSNFFDTTDRLCTSADTEPCEWSDKNNRIKVKADPPPEGASLGIGFNSNLSYSCEGDSTPAGGAVVNINPRYEETDPPVGAIAVTLTYTKASTPGPANNYDVCFRKDEDTEWGTLDQCSSTSPSADDAPCFISRKNVTGGDLEVVLWVATDDPWGGIS